VNPSLVLDGVHGKVAALNHGLLPPDVQVVPYLDRWRALGPAIGAAALTVVLAATVGREYLPTIDGGIALNVSSAVGFIALFGVAVQNGVLMVSHLNEVRARSTGDLASAVVEGARGSLRPVLLTATVATLGLLPAALARGIGSDVQRPLATVVVGGLVTATALTLTALPTLYFVVERRLARGAER
jgi:cobalt-zinc-cadmium resistance protein CzcA